MARLADYHAKRNFRVTKEPRGRIVPAGKQLRFVIQRHDATRLHFDLRLELGGVYKSWAVTKVPSLAPSVKRLAVEVEDHPIDYGTFEGTIPAGEYGGGTVQLWDRGTWEPDTPGDPTAALAKGHIKFTLHGERMQGGWALVRMQDRPAKGAGKNRHNWLLIKEKDDAAKPGDPDALAAADTSVKTGRTLKEIAEDKSKVWHSKPSKTVALQIAPKKRSAKAAEKPSRLPGFIEPQLCHVTAAPPASGDWVHEVKFDGYRIEMRVEKSAVQLFTRRGLDWTTRFPEIAAEAKDLPDGLYDGEIVALGDEGVSDFAGLQEALSTGKTSALVYFLFDILHFGGHDLREETLWRRKEILAEVLERHAVRKTHLRFVEHFASTGEAVLEAACRMKLEGVISKRREAPYRSGRSDSWTKSKCRGGQEVVIGGWWGDAEQLRSLLVGVFRKGEFVYMGRIGTGFNASLAREVLDKLKPLKRATCPFQGDNKPPRQNGVNWTEPKAVAEVEFGTITAAGLLRQASFKGLREDKPAKTIVAEPQPAAQRSSAKATKMPQSAQIGTEHHQIAGIVLSHPDKVLWPAAKPTAAFTKLDLAEHYQAFAERMLAHVAGRPVTLVRAPDGIDGQKFYQRHAGKQAIQGRLIKVSGESEPYIAFDDAKGLVSLAQAAVLEIHPWGCKSDKPDVPEHVIFDLDPAPDVSFDRVIAAAKDIRARLTALGLEPFVKTTGGKGLHVVAAVKGRPRHPLSWAEVKHFAQMLCLAMARDSPSAYITTMAKKARAGKIYLDYLRNDRTATAVAPWSPRARPHAPIATPLAWSQIKSGLDPLAFTLGTAKVLLKRADPWADMAKSAARLPVKL